MALPAFPRVLFSGIQPTSTLHIGNLFAGAIQPFLDHSHVEDETRLFAIADLHALTTILPNSATATATDKHKSICAPAPALYEMTLDTARTLMACGISSGERKTILFRQSDIAEHTLLSWLLTTLTSVPMLQRMTQWKDKTAASKKFIKEPAGLLMYPVLQAADVLLYRSTVVPVGPDQMQHLELVRRLARRFNNALGCSYFPEPRAPAGFLGARVMSLVAPESSKMSKSDLISRSRITVTDSNDEISAKIRAATTDSLDKVGAQIVYNPIDRPGVSNLISIYALCRGCTVNEVCEREDMLKGLAQCGQLKKMVIEALVQRLGPIREQIKQISRADAEAALREGGLRAKEIASRNWVEIARLACLHKDFITHQPKLEVDATLRAKL